MWKRKSEKKRTKKKERKKAKQSKKNVHEFGLKRRQYLIKVCPNKVKTGVPRKCIMSAFQYFVINRHESGFEKKEEKKQKLRRKKKGWNELFPKNSKGTWKLKKSEKGWNHPKSEWDFCIKYIFHFKYSIFNNTSIT